MLLAIVADVKATFYIYVTHIVDFGRCYCQFFRLMFFAIVVDVITTFV